MTTKNGKDGRVELTAEEEDIRAAHVAQGLIDRQARDDADAQKAADQASGNAKLLGLGLTQSEATSLTGYVYPPPVEE